MRFFLINTVIESLKRTDMTAPIKCVTKSKYQQYPPCSTKQKAQMQMLIATLQKQLVLMDVASVCFNLLLSPCAKPQPAYMYWHVQGVFFDAEAGLVKLRCPAVYVSIIPTIYCFSDKRPSSSSSFAQAFLQSVSNWSWSVYYLCALNESRAVMPPSGGLAPCKHYSLVWIGATVFCIN